MASKRLPFQAMNTPLPRGQSLLAIHILEPAYSLQDVVPAGHHMANSTIYIARLVLTTQTVCRMRIVHIHEAHLVKYQVSTALNSTCHLRSLILAKELIRWLSLSLRATIEHSHALGTQTHYVAIHWWSVIQTATAS